MNTRVSELEAEHRALGAGLGDWNGMDVAWSYATSAEKEHDAVREAAGLFDVSGLKKVWIKGPDALAVVEKIATRDMSRIYKGKSAYCPLLTDAGTICDDNIIFHVDDNKYLYVQVIDDSKGHTLASASTIQEALSGTLGAKTDTLAAAKLLGTTIANRAKEKGIKQVAFDRGGYRYHGRIKAIADAAREAGLEF